MEAIPKSDIKCVIKSDTFFGTWLALSNDLGAKPIQLLKLSKNYSQRKIMTPPCWLRKFPSSYLSFLQSGAHKNG